MGLIQQENRFVDNIQKLQFLDVPTIPTHMLYPQIHMEYSLQ